MTLEELMPDPERRDVALGGLAIVVEHADEIYPGHAPPQPHKPRGNRQRYLDVLQEMSYGHDRTAAARRLGISAQTVMSHTKKARQALKAKSTLHAVAEALRRGLIE